MRLKTLFLVEAAIESHKQIINTSLRNAVSYRLSLSAFMGEHCLGIRSNCSRQAPCEETNGHPHRPAADKDPRRSPPELNTRSAGAHVYSQGMRMHVCLWGKGDMGWWGGTTCTQQHSWEAGSPLEAKKETPSKISLKGCEAASVWVIYDDKETQKRVCFWEVPAAGKAGAFPSPGRQDPDGCKSSARSCFAWVSSYKLKSGVNLSLTFWHDIRRKGKIVSSQLSRFSPKSFMYL